MHHNRAEAAVWSCNISDDKSMMDAILLRDLETMEKPEPRAAIFETHEWRRRRRHPGEDILRFALCFICLLGRR